jgi:L-rhamnose-H+ transport protein
MTPLASAPWIGLLLVLVAGSMCGVFALPMRFMGRWSWENVWAIFILIACVGLPVVVTWSTAGNFVPVLRATPGHAVAAACLTGFAWGFGAIMFGQGVSAIGMAMSNTLVLALSAALGSFLPMMVLAPERLQQPQGIAIVCGTAIGLAGIVCFGFAGFGRDRSQASEMEEVRGSMVGNARPFGVGLLLCAGAGVLSAVLNIGYSLAQPVIATAVRSGDSSFAGSNIVWLLALGSGAIPNLCFCAYLIRKNRSWYKFSLPGSAKLYMGAIVMGLLWGGDITVYGLASPKLGKLGPAIGWPVKLITGLITANAAGILIGEWRSTRNVERRWLAAGFVILLIAIAVLGWSSRLA